MNKPNIKTVGKFIILAVVAILLVKGGELMQKRDDTWDAFYRYQAVPDVRLTNTLKESGGIVSGEVGGFVKFDNISNQPKELKQYYIIKALNKFDSNSLQYFSLEEIIKAEYIPPTSLGVSELIEVAETANTITLEDESGNHFFINKISGEVSARDTTGDNTTLITNDSDYKAFMKEFLFGS